MGEQSDLKYLKDIEDKELLEIHKNLCPVSSYEIEVFKKFGLDRMYGRSRLMKPTFESIEDCQKSYKMVLCCISESLKAYMTTLENKMGILPFLSLDEIYNNCDHKDITKEEFQRFIYSIDFLGGTFLEEYMVSEVNYFKLCTHNLSNIPTGSGINTSEEDLNSSI